MSDELIPCPECGRPPKQYPSGKVIFCNSDCPNDFIAYGAKPEIAVTEWQRFASQEHVKKPTNLCQN